MTDFWKGLNKCSVESFKNIVKQRLLDQFKQQWSGEVFNSNVCSNYRMFKQVLEFEKYLYLPENLRLYISKFRCGNHHFPIVTGRYAGIPHDVRICSLCDSNELGDEFHYLFNCKSVCEERKKYLSKFFCTFPNVEKFKDLFCRNEKALNKVALFCKHLLLTVK